MNVLISPLVRRSLGMTSYAISSDDDTLSDSMDEEHSGQVRRRHLSTLGRPFSLWRHFITTTIIPFVFSLLCNLVQWNPDITMYQGTAEGGGGGGG